MATTPPQKILIDCSAQPGISATVPALLEQAAVAARAGDADQTQELMALAAQRSADAANEPATVTIVPLDADELEQKDVDAAAFAEMSDQAVARAWIELRMKRDRLLAQTDAFFISPLPSDFPADKAKEIAANADAWKAFRQQLRDLPANTTDPATVDWPTSPAAPQVYLT